MHAQHAQEYCSSDCSLSLVDSLLAITKYLVEEESLLEQVCVCHVDGLGPMAVDIKEEGRPLHSMLCDNDHNVLRIKAGQTSIGFQE